MPVAKGESTTRQQILLYSIQLLLITLLPLPFQTLGPLYTVSALLLGLGLIYRSLVLIRVADGAEARNTYKYSTAYLAFLFMAMILDRLLL